MDQADSGSLRIGDGSALRTVAEVAFAGLAMGALAWLSITLTSGGSRVAAIWPANAVILAALIRRPSRLWAWFLAAGMGGDLVTNLIVGDRMGVAAGLAVCNGLEIFVCAAGLRLMTGDRLDLSRIPHLTVFAVLALFTSGVTALGGATVLELGTQHSFIHSLAIWMMADVLGLMLVTPALMALDRRAWARFVAPGHATLNVALLAMLGAVTVFVCLQPHMEFRYLIFGALVLVSFTGEIAGAALGLLLTGALVVAVFGLDFAPDAHATDGHVGAVMLQLFLLASAAICFPVAGAMARRRELEEALAATADEFRTLADNSNDIILRFDRDQRIVYVSPSCRRLGYQPEQIQGLTVDAFVHPDDLQRVRERIGDMMSGGEALGVFEQRVRAASGDWIWLEGTPQILAGPDGRPSGWISQLRDVTGRKLAQEALAESEARYRLLADRATDIILQSDADGTVRYISPACSRLGWTPEEMIGRSALEFVHPDDRQLTVDRLTALFAGAPQTLSERREYRALNKDGEVVWLEGNSSVVRDDTGRILGAVSLLRDVTERREIEDELRRKQAEAEAATIAKSEFLANMSHEIRTPLTGILGFAGLLEDAEGLPDGARVFTARIATASRALLAVVNDILDFSKIEAGQIELDPLAFDPAAFVTETVELVAAQAQEKRLVLRTAIDGVLPGGVMADPARLRQVLLNLLTNAVKFTDAGSVTVKVSYQVEGGGRLKLAVSDTGVGIPAERTHRLFQRFSQADGSINRQYGGTGLGLAICKSLTHLMGGEIGVDSIPGEGSTFWVTVVAPTCELAPRTTAPLDDVVAVRPARILVVDDSPVNRELVGVLLSVFGHALTEAGGGREAVEIAAGAAFDLILMDLQMPGMDGLAAAREIRAHCPLNRATPIVALSANILPAHLQACREAGMDDHIAKPIDTRELLTKVARWTEEAREAEPEAAQA